MPAAFGELQVGEFFEALSAYRAKELQDRRHVGELVRGATLRLWNLQVDRKSRISVPSRFWLMPWDDDVESAEEELADLTPEDREDSLQKMLKLMGEHNVND